MQSKFVIFVERVAFFLMYQNRAKGDAKYSLVCHPIFSTLVRLGLTTQSQFTLFQNVHSLVVPQTWKETGFGGGIRNYPV